MYSKRHVRARAPELEFFEFAELNELFGALADYIEAGSVNSIIL